MAEGALTLILSLGHQVVRKDRITRSGDWTIFRLQVATDKDVYGQRVDVETPRLTPEKYRDVLDQMVRDIAGRVQ